MVVDMEVVESSRTERMALPLAMMVDMVGILREGYWMERKFVYA
jgi:hypothetical protein